ncbi:hypothetical protein MYXA107069_13335 [Myxococcus xanthus]|nr:hypothetical protein MyxoNM_16850 [Myxococcus xanthus]SDX82413.1 hypothetical protein SAMN05444383_11396 [Myxococcus xanthus]
MAALHQTWWPHVFIDCHTTDGSIHAFDLTFDTSHSNEPLFSKLRAYNRGMLERVAKAVQGRHGFDSFWYGNYKDEGDPRSGWHTYPALPRFGSHYRGLLGRLDVLLETYSYIDFPRRCAVMRAWLLELFRDAARPPPPTAPSPTRRRRTSSRGASLPTWRRSEAQAGALRDGPHGGPGAHHTRVPRGDALRAHGPARRHARRVPAGMTASAAGSSSPAPSPRVRCTRCTAWWAPPPRQRRRSSPAAGPGGRGLAAGAQWRRPGVRRSSRTSRRVWFSSRSATWMSSRMSVRL